MEELSLSHPSIRTLRLWSRLRNLWKKSFFFVEAHLVSGFLKGSLMSLYIKMSGFRVSVKLELWSTLIFYFLSSRLHLFILVSASSVVGVLCRHRERHLLFFFFFFVLDCVSPVVVVWYVEWYLDVSSVLSVARLLPWVFISFLAVIVDLQSDIIYDKLCFLNWLCELGLVLWLITFFCLLVLRKFYFGLGCKGSLCCRSQVLGWVFPALVQRLEFLFMFTYRKLQNGFQKLRTIKMEVDWFLVLVLGIEMIQLRL